MPMSEYVARLRVALGHETILLPAVTVLPLDGDGRVVLVKHMTTDQWGLVGGSIDIDEDPADAARREALEETGLEVSLTRLVAALGGPAFRITYANGTASYVQIVYEATVTGGTPCPDHDETSAVAWVRIVDLASTDLNDFARATFEALGWI